MRQCNPRSDARCCKREQASRARLGTSPEGLTNEELLERYLISKEVAPVRREQLMNAAREIFDEVQG